ncbi:MAG: fatty acid desaturase family protein [Proteobacteria bacterium]|nr:fatty acid desaturase family protein [Pseudomonadota bacterium]
MALRSRWLTALEVGSILGFSVLWGLAAERLFPIPGPQWALVILMLFPAATAADALSGAVHWFADTWLAEDTPWIGSWVIAPFREHHRDPEAIARHDVWERNGNGCLAALPLVGLALYLPAPETAPARMAVAGLLWLAALLAFTNQIHCWAHQARVPRPVAWLQRWGCILSPRAHALHHRAPHATAYCVTNGWCNAALDRLGLFGRVERAVRRLASPRGATRSARGDLR